eukprot:TRINITY_DN673_c0_g6_i1.p2 TRINITY_DN673_c0_g6~~TRINITY_DN673_c0_g6_i1.p2  ORF type:complete len:280 (-),score=59.12 TRINITY_DN673_c0_g6_i1:167-1006(-)
MSSGRDSRVLSALAAAAVVASAPAFLSAGAGKNSLRATAVQTSGATAAPVAAATPGSSTSTLFTASAAAALLGAGAVFQTRSRKSPAPQCQAVRRDLAVAYEDSGIELLDNGKFAQGLVGSDGAWGRYEFDPAGFSSRFYEYVPYFREAELKHGRIAMLAWLGLVVPDFIRIPGERYSFEAVPTVIDAHDKLNSAVGVNVQVLFWVTLVELCCAKKVFEWNSLEVAGDYGLGYQFLPKDEEGQKRMRMAELKNGRLAMVAFGGAITQAVLTRHPFPWLF